MSPEKRLVLTDLGEDELLARLCPLMPLESGVLVGPGDDCAVLGSVRNKRYRLLKTDAVVSGVHFTHDTDPFRVGCKALNRCISDVAAMGGLPESALVTLAASRELPVETLEKLYKGFRSAARPFRISIVGGELTGLPPGGNDKNALLVSISMTGWVEAASLTLRSGGKPGDLIFVTGRLGGSIEGHHLDFTPRLPEARWLAEHCKPHAMMDLSDGLARDLPRLACASECGYHLKMDALPITRGCTRERALGDGEDYELLFVIDQEKADILRDRWPSDFVMLTEIGRLTADREEQALEGGWDHF